MKTLFELNVLENKKVAWTLNLLSFPLIFVFIFLFYLVGTNLVSKSLVLSADVFVQSVWFGPALLVTIVVHELIHGIFFKIYQMDRPVKFGFSWKTFMAYASSPGSLYNRHQFAVISLSPFVFLSLFFTLALVLGWISLKFYVLLASIHAAACIGDFYYFYLIFFKFGKENILVEDTPVGMSIYQG